VSVIARELKQDVDRLEKWPPAKAMAYFEKAMEIRRLFGGGM